MEERGGQASASRLNRNPLDLIKCNLVAGPVIELGGARTFVGSHGLRVFEGAAGFELGRDAGCSKRVIADLDLHAELAGGAPDHAPGIDACMASPVSSPVRPRAERKRGPLSSPAIPAARTYSSRKASSLWCAGISWRLPPFSCSRISQPYPFDCRSSTRILSAAPMRAKP
jgi:hypothetical protein